MSEVTGFQECSHENVSSVRCKQHRGWCGVCKECGKDVHAPDDVFMLKGKEVYRESELHQERL